MTVLKVMTWNVENLFRSGNEFGARTQEKYTQKLRSLADAILELGPNILAIQEIGDLEAFTELTALLKGRYPHTCVSAFSDPRGIRVGFLSKYTIEEQEELVDFPQGSFIKVLSQGSEERLTEVTRMGRGALRILVKPEQSIPIHLINAHLKSKLLTFPSTSNYPRFTPKDENERTRFAGLALLRRTAEAVALRVKANELLEKNKSLEDDLKYGLIMLGDMNDVTSAATTQILQGPGGSEIGTRGFNFSDEGDSTRLFNLAPLIPAEKRYSRIYQNNKELIDHILVSQELLPGKPRNLPQVNSHVDIINPLPSVNNDPSSRRGEPGSDHAPITATFDF